MGGNQSLKLAGELGQEPPRQLKGSARSARRSISLPVQQRFASRGNWIYEQRFVRSLARTMREKDRLFPGRLRPAVDSIGSAIFGIGTTIFSHTTDFVMRVTTMRRRARSGISAGDQGSDADHSRQG
jgi:hypothetical protein